MNEMILTSKQTPIEIALDIDATGHTTARKLYAWLELDQSHYNRWVKQSITENPYAIEGEDYEIIPLTSSKKGGRPSQDFFLSASFAKRIAMASKSQRGEETRLYFVKIEQALANKILQDKELMMFEFAQSTNPIRHSGELTDEQRERNRVNNHLRYQILKRDGFRCQICGRSAKDDGVKLHVDHIKPISKGGKTKESNLRTLCEECNLGKKDDYDEDGLN